MVKPCTDVRYFNELRVEKKSYQEDDNWTQQGHEIIVDMIFLLVTLLAWSILSMGMLGIDWGYATLSKTRLQAVAHSLVLFPLSEHEALSFKDEATMGILGLDSSSVVTRTFHEPLNKEVQISQEITLPLTALLIDQTTSEQSHTQASLLKPVDSEDSGLELEQRRKKQVKSSAIVALRPARQVGLAHHGNSSLPGAIPCVFKRTFWESLDTNSSAFGVINTYGEILVHDRKVGQFGQMTNYIGEEIQGPRPFNETDIHLNGYVSVSERIGNTDYVIGFGHVDIQGTQSHLAITLLPSTGQSLNASRLVTGDLSHMKKEELSKIFSINRNLKNAIVAPTLTS
ncbi:MAG: Tad domain-containing protein [Nitrospirales bacterium]